MTWKNNLLLKTFLLSLAIHISGVFLFSLVLPLSIREIKPLEVSLLPLSASSETPVSELTAGISTALPTASAKSEGITVVTRREVLRFAPQEVTGVSKAITPVEIIFDTLELPDIKLPEIVAFNLVGSSSEKSSASSDIEIEGPAGERIPIYREPITYPGWAIEKSLEGIIRIKFWVDPDGKIALTNLITSSGFAELDLYAEQTFRRWIFEPINTDKQAWGLITFRFHLR
ncbi:MAG: energy transducer TonB [Elusimicrobia bacterium]|nr:energy transducer TonB [Elusimicrobiota bacterium]